MLKTRFFSICIFLCAIASTSRIFASDYYSNALRLYSEGQYFVASIEFERAVFYETDNIRIAHCKYYKSLCYKATGETGRALEELGEINMFNMPDSLFFMIRYEQALGNYLNGDPNIALWNIDEIKFRFPGSSRSTDIIPLNILCLNSLRKWDEALFLWNYLLDNSGLDEASKTDFLNEVSEYYKKRNIPKYHSPKKAETLSRFIPGSGQVYSGAVLEGTFNLLINASLLGFAAYGFYEEYYLTGYFVGLGLFNKTYHGGMHRANLLADNKNREDLNEFNAGSGTLLLRILDKRNDSGKSYSLPRSQKE